MSGGASAFSEKFIQAVVAGIREYNRTLPPTVLIRRGEDLVSVEPPHVADQQFFEAVRYGLQKAAAECQS